MFLLISLVLLAAAIAVIIWVNVKTRDVPDSEEQESDRQTFSL